MIDYIIGGLIISIGIYVFYRHCKKNIKIKSLEKEILWGYPKTCENCKYFEKDFLQDNGTCEDGTYRECNNRCELFKFNSMIYYKVKKQAKFRYEVKRERK